MVSRTKNQSLSVSGEWVERNPSVSRTNIDREDFKMKSCRIEANEKGQSQVRDKNQTEPSDRNRTEPTGQSHGSCLRSAGSANLGNRHQSSSSMEIRTQCKHSDEIGEDLNSGWRRRQARAYFRKPYPALCSLKATLSVEKESPDFS